MFRIEDISEEEILKSSILIVDDISFNLEIIKTVLESRGFSNLYFVKDATSAEEIIEIYNINLIILDLMLPEISGFEFAIQIRNNPKYKHIPVIIQTALTQQNQRKKAFEAGASDYITKPIDPDELVSRVFTHLERVKMIEKLSAYNNRIQTELAAAKEIVKIFLPRQEDVRIFEDKYQLAIANHYEMSSELGGDLWNFRAIDKNLAAFYIADFSGHGLTAALHASMLNSIIFQGNLSVQPDEFLSYINQNLAKILPTGIFATMFYGVFDLEKHLLYYSGAGQTNPIIIAANNDITILDGSGFPLGISTKSTYEVKSIPFSSGDRIILFSDALLETEDQKGEFFSEEKLCKFLRNNAALCAGNPKLLLAKLLEYFDAHHRKFLTDDLTINIYHHL